MSRVNRPWAGQAGQPGDPLCQELMQVPGMLGPPQPCGMQYPGSGTRDALLGMMDLGSAPAPGRCRHRVGTVPTPIHSQVLLDVPSLPQAEQHL